LFGSTIDLNYGYKDSKSNMVKLKKKSLHIDICLELYATMIEEGKYTFLNVYLL